MNPKILAGLLMMVLWVVVAILVCVRYPPYRNPLSGSPGVSLFWLLMVLMIAWNAMRVLTTWQKSMDRPKPPIRREIEDEPENPFA